MINLATILETSARQRPDHEALILGDTRLSYGQFDGAANQVANGLAAAGIGPGDRVALSCPNLPYFPIVYFGILKTGAAVLPTNVLLKRDEIGYLLEDSEAKAYLCFEGTEELPLGGEGHAAYQATDSCTHFWMITADPAAASAIEGTQTLGALMAGQAPVFDTHQGGADDIAVVLYTSGTTGQPKGAELTHSNILMNAMVTRAMAGGSGDDVQLVTLPLFHVFGQVVQMNAGLMAGATLVLVPRFDPGTVLALMEAHDVTVFAGVPTMYWALLNYPDADKHDLAKIKRTMRLACAGGSSLPVEVLRAFEAKFDVPILEGYGLSETSPVVTFNQLGQERKPGSVGTPVWGVEMRVVDENDEPLGAGEPGEVVVRGHCVMRGYLNRPEATAEAFRGGWFHTGDIGQIDEDGYLYIVDRLKEMIIRGGFNVYPREIEELLLTHPSVSLAAVVGIPDEEYGEEIKAYVVPKPGAEIDPDEVIAWSKERLAGYKYPRVVESRDSLPLSATGKILKKELR
ncbi:MAG: long-chain fatty acid--CoA ligase [Alphaproteobacteria bacterium]|jgi:long-chain acyl-CoA synthetase|nr:long-chain fatty acid--CoA ligase [Alphaproteobacteria bacterium]MDP6515196.1 long-chain fatty acid--CoA ligase [Alphaproteobacteria bacterium]